MYLPSFPVNWKRNKSVYAASKVQYRKSYATVVILFVSRWMENAGAGIFLGRTALRKKRRNQEQSPCLLFSVRNFLCLAVASLPSFGYLTQSSNRWTKEYRIRDDWNHISAVSMGSVFNFTFGLKAPFVCTVHYYLAAIKCNKQNDRQQASRQRNPADVCRCRTGWKKNLHEL